MRFSVVHWASAVAIGLMVNLTGGGAADAQSVINVCADEWKQAKVNGTTNETWQQFLAQCRAQHSGEASTVPALAPAPARTAAPATAAGKLSPPVETTASASTGQMHGPPDSFRGIKWDSALPSVQKLRETALKGCASVVEQKNFTDTPPCSHMHLDIDDQDLFIQREHVPDIYNVPVTEQLLTWSNRRFWSGTAFVYNYNEFDLAKIRDGLISEYGQPTFTNEDLHLTKWQWPKNKIEISFYYDPIAKRDLGSSRPPATTLTLAFGKTD